MNNIDLNIYENGSLPSLDIDDTIDKIPNEQKIKFLELCCSKLAYNGVLKLRGVNLDSFCKNYILGQPANINNILNLSSVTPLSELGNILAQNGVQIVKVNIDSSHYIVEGTKN